MDNKLFIHANYSGFRSVMELIYTLIGEPLHTTVIGESRTRHEYANLTIITGKYVPSDAHDERMYIEVVMNDVPISTYNDTIVSFMGWDSPND